MGTCLLPRVPEPPPRISRRVVERRQLGRNQQTLRVLQVRQASKPRARFRLSVISAANYIKQSPGHAGALFSQLNSACLLSFPSRRLEASVSIHDFGFRLQPVI